MTELQEKAAEIENWTAVSNNPYVFANGFFSINTVTYGSGRFVAGGIYQIAYADWQG